MCNSINLGAGLMQLKTIFLLCLIPWFWGCLCQWKWGKLKKKNMCGRPSALNVLFCIWSISKETLFPRHRILLTVSCGAIPRLLKSMSAFEGNVSAFIWSSFLVKKSRRPQNIKIQYKVLFNFLINLMLNDNQVHKFSQKFIYFWKKKSHT